MDKKTSHKKHSHKFAEVVSVVSHQLKNPLAVIKGCLEVLLSGDFGRLTAKQKEYLNFTLQNTQRMIDLVKNLLDVSRIEEGKLEFKPQPSDLKEITEEVMDEFSFLAQAKNCTISLRALNEIPLLRFDPFKIKQVIENLISNAINYSGGKGRIQITLVNKGNKVIFCCQDNGIGIVDREKKKIFTKFYRSEKAVVLATEGSGLGLFISRAIIEKSGGKIWFESQEEKGSTFCFSLPLIYSVN